MDIKIYPCNPVAMPPEYCSGPDETIKPNEIYIKGPLHLLFTYKVDDKNWGFFYRSMIDGQYLHAEENTDVEEEVVEWTSIHTRVNLVNEEDVVANYFALNGIWVDREFSDWPMISQEARDMINKMSLPKVKEIIGDCVVNISSFIHGWVSRGQENKP